MREDLEGVGRALRPEHFVRRHAMGIDNLSRIPDEIKTMVEKLNQKNYGKLDFEFLNPSQDQALQELLQKFNIMTLSWPALSKGEVPPGKGAIGLVMEYGDKSLTRPMAPLPGGTSPLERAGQESVMILNFCKIACKA